MREPMGLDWPNTIVHDPELYQWIADRLFPLGEILDEAELHQFDPSAFESEMVLFRYPSSTPPTSLIEAVIFGSPKPASFTQAQLNDAVMHACRACGYYPVAWWFGVNVSHYGDRVVKHVGKYKFRAPLEPLFTLLVYNGADQLGNSYAGLLDEKRQWVLLFNYSVNCAIRISVHGTPQFCNEVATYLKNPVKEA